MKIKNLILSSLITLTTFTGISAFAYPSADIVSQLPGVYQGVTQKQACEVRISKNLLGMVEFQIALLDGSNSKIIFDTVHILKLKAEYIEDYNFRIQQDKHFDPETDNAWLNLYVNHGMPNIFGIFPQTDKLSLDWDATELTSIDISIGYSSGSYMDTNIDPRNQHMRCAALKRIE